MYAAMLNFAQANEYTALMTKNDLLDYDSSERRFHIKEKGRELLEIMDKCDSVFSKQALEVVTLPQI
jgi:predicted transcriptional regulator